MGREIEKNHLEHWERVSYVCNISVHKPTLNTFGYKNGGFVYD